MVFAVLFILYLSNTLRVQASSYSSFGFLTPDLFQKTGEAFWRAFFFELPFVILRTLPLIFFIVGTIFYTYYGSKAKKIYDREAKK